MFPSPFLVLLTLHPSLHQAKRHRHPHFTCSCRTWHIPYLAAHLLAEPRCRQFLTCSGQQFYLIFVVIFAVLALASPNRVERVIVPAFPYLAAHLPAEPRARQFLTCCGQSFCLIFDVIFGVFALASPNRVESVLVPAFSEVPIMGYIASGGGLLWIAANPNSYLDVCLANAQGLSLTSFAPLTSLRRSVDYHNFSSCKPQVDHACRH